MEGPGPGPGAERRRAKFAVVEDVQLRQLVAEYGVENWRQIASRMPGRNPRQCRERWKHYLSGTGGQIPWTMQEDQILFAKVRDWGPRWTRIANFLGSRTDIEVKTRWLQKFNPIAPAAPNYRIGVPPVESQPRPAPPPPFAGPPMNQWRNDFAPITLPPQVQAWFTQTLESER
jgi:hypothetical protein